jgi:hypothetical protein
MSKLRSATVCFSVGIYQILNEISVHETLEMSLVAEAIRRSTRKLNGDASIEEIREYLSGYEEEALNGVLANVKGIYHELIFEHSENYDGDSITARLFEKTNHPGADVEFMMNGEVISQVQLKAVKSKELVLEHFEKYPNIDVYATSEVASELGGVEDSGFSNEELEASVYEFAEQFGFEDLLEKTAKGFALGTAASLAVAIALSIREKRISKRDVKRAIQDGYFTAAFGAMVDFVINDDRFF